MHTYRKIHHATTTSLYNSPPFVLIGVQFPSSSSLKCCIFAPPHPSISLSLYIYMQICRCIGVDIYNEALIVITST